MLTSSGAGKWPRTHRPLIDGAKHTLFVQNERYQDSVIIERLVRAKVRGVKVHIMARPRTPSRKKNLSKASAACAS